MHTSLSVSALFISSVLSAQSYGLEELTDDHERHIAPASIQRFVRSTFRKDFRECITDLGADLEDAEHYFGSIQVNLSTRSLPCFAVFPSKYCQAFYGAHAIAYWLITEFKPGRYRLLYEGRSDGFKLRSSSSNGFFDFESGYGKTYTVLRFNGKRYRRISNGEYPADSP